MPSKPTVQEPWYHDLVLWFRELSQKKEQAAGPKNPPQPENNNELGGGSSEIRPGLYALALAINYALLLAAAVLMHKVWYLVLIIALLQFALGWSVAHDQEVVTVTIFDIPIKEPKLGPFFKTWPMQALRLPSVPQQFQFPDEPERVYNGDDKDPLPEGMMRPYRVMSGGPSKDYVGPLNIQMSASVTGTVRWGIIHPLAFKRQLAGHTAEEKIKEAKRQMYDTWSNALVKEYQCRPIGLVVDLTATTITDSVRADIEKATAAWGVRIFEVTVRSPNLGHSLSGKIAEIGEANAEAIASNKRTDAQVYTIEQTGTAQGKADLARRMAEADGVAYEAEKLGIEGGDIFAARAAKEIFGDKDTFVFGAEGIIEKVGAGMAAMQGFRKLNQRKAPNA